LKERQENALNALEKLRTEVDSLKAKFGVDSTVTAKAVTNTSTFKEVPITLPKGNMDFVIFCSPSHPSFSPVLISEILRSRGVDVSTPTQLHSSLIENLDSCMLEITGGLHGRNQLKDTNIKFTFIWKDEAFCPYMMASSSTRIFGDVNIARYLIRLFIPTMYDEKNIEMVVDIDQCLGNISQMHHGSSKEKDAAIKFLNVRLGKHDHICSNGSMSIADIVAYSAVLANHKHFKTLPKNVSKWFMNVPNCFQSLAKIININESWFS